MAHPADADAEAAATTAAAGASSAAGTHQCWACAIVINVPLVDGAPAPLFRCGWCGATNDRRWSGGGNGGGNDAAGFAAHYPPPVASRRRRRARAAAKRALRVLCVPLRWLVVAFVVVLMAAVGAVGVGVVIPRAFATPFARAAHSGFALGLLLVTVCLADGRGRGCAWGIVHCLLSCHWVLCSLPRCPIQTMNPKTTQHLTPQSLHYVAACARRNSSRPASTALLAPPPLRGAGSPPPAGSFEGWAFCRHPRCRAPKPPGTHHCSTVRAALG